MQRAVDVIDAGHQLMAMMSVEMYSVFYSRLYTKMLMNGKWRCVQKQ
jgi:hypothetical protein